MPPDSWKIRSASKGSLAARPRLFESWVLALQPATPCLGLACVAQGGEERRGEERREVGHENVTLMSHFPSNTQK